MKSIKTTRGISAPDPCIIAEAEAETCALGVEFDAKYCQIRHYHARKLESQGKRWRFEPCGYCPLVIKHIAQEKGEAATKSAYKAEADTKRPMCKKCGKCRAKDGFEYCSYCLKHAGRTIFKNKSETEEDTTMTKKNCGPQNDCPVCGKKMTVGGKCKSCTMTAIWQKKDAAKEKKLCKDCNKELAKANKFGLCRSCNARKNTGIATASRSKAAREKNILPAADTIHARTFERLPIATFMDGTIIERPAILPDIYRRALQRWGNNHQIAKTAEEAAELSAAIVRYLSAATFGNLSKVCGVVNELADMEIMCQQMRLVFGDKAVDDAVQSKLARLSERLES
jgi:hypothetical protein